MMHTEGKHGIGDSNLRSGLGICMDSKLMSAQLMLKYLYSGATVCMISMRWPASMVDSAMRRLGIQQVISYRTDLKTTTLDPKSIKAKSLERFRNQQFHDGGKTILFTSGTTDYPKAVVHSAHQHIISAERVVKALNLGSQDRWLLSLPLWHVSGMSIVFRCLIANAEVVVPDPQTSLYESISAKRITHISLVSAQLLQIMERSAPSHICAVILGGGPVPTHVIETARNNGWPVHTSYGMTETSSMITLSHKSFNPNSMGYSLSGHEIKITGDQEIMVRSSALCSGYLIDGKIRSIVDDDGWFHTGDLGMIDTDQQLHILGRKDNMFISGGENISPEEIESHINRFPQVQESVVIPVHDPKFGQRPVAFVRGLAHITDLSDYLVKYLPKFMIPQIYQWPESIAPNMTKLERKEFINEAMRLQATANDRSINMSKSE